MKKTKNKVLLLGWDAADWKLIDKFMAEGKMPSLKKFLSEGVRGNIATLDPPLSPMLWTSIATGKRAYDHGILGFVEPDPNGTDVRSINSTSRKVKAIWNILNQEGFKSNITAWWPSFPVEKINGNMVCNFIQVAHEKKAEDWVIGENMIHPISLKEELLELRVHPTEITPNLVEPFIPRLREIDTEKDPSLYRFINIFSQTITVHSIATHFLRNKPADFNAVYFDGLDHFSHVFMRYAPPKMTHIKQKYFDLYNQVIEGAYRFFDMMLETYLNLIDEDTTVLIVSDHGFHSDHLRPKFIPKDPAGPAVEHRSLGVFCARGPQIKKGESIYGASIIDITPTLLTLFDLPIGKDMEGKPLLQIFNQNIEPKFIDSWENVPGDDARHAESLRLDPWAEKHAMDQLIELGYIESPGEDKKKNRDIISEETEFYLAKSYINGKKIEQAIPLLRELQAKRPEKARFAVALLHSLLDKRHFLECKSIIDFYRSRKEIKGYYLDYFEGKLNQTIFKPRLANEFFERALKDAGEWAELYFEVGKSLMALNQWSNAEIPIRKAIQIDGENAYYYNSLGVVLFRQERMEEALDSFFEAIERTYYIPSAHYHIGECFFYLNRIEESINAFLITLKLYPAHQNAHLRLIKIYESLNQTEKIKPHKEFMEKVKKTVYLVSGLPRSGTSMMMQMLHKGGMDVLVDEKRLADTSNPKGYYEFEPVKALIRDKSWLPQAEGKVVKVIAQLLNQLPSEFEYKVVFMQRPMNEVLKSQQVMLKQDTSNFPTAIAQAFDKTLLLVKEWAKNNPNVEIHYVNYHDVINTTMQEAENIQSFLKIPLNLNNMIEAVHPELHRNKS